MARFLPALMPLAALRPFRAVPAGQAHTRAAAGAGQGGGGASLAPRPGEERDTHAAVGTQKLMEVLAKPIASGKALVKGVALSIFAKYDKEEFTVAALPLTGIGKVEIKINLLSQESHAKVASALGADHVAKYEQENFFFDGCEGELSSQRATLRVRIYNRDEKAELTLKGKAVMNEGVGTAPELEEQLDVQFAHTAVSNPQQLLALDSAVMKNVKMAFAPEFLKCLGGFRNTRNVYTWNGHNLELDETHFDFGTMYELECETEDPETLKPQLEEYLRGQGVDYKYSTTTKFARFLKRTLE